jgi:hypothetical protein
MHDGSQRLQFVGVETEKAEEKPLIEGSLMCSYRRDGVTGPLLGGQIARCPPCRRWIGLQGAKQSCRKGDESGDQFENTAYRDTHEAKR